MQSLSFADRIFEIGLKAWEKLPALVLTLIVGFLLIRLLKTIIHSLIRVSRANAAMKGILISVIDVALWIFLIAALLQQVGLTQIAFALSGTVAIAGVAISVGSSAFIQDLVSGVFLAQDPDFNPGDEVKVGDVVGSVERMDARKIRIRDSKGQLHVFPNSTFDKTAWTVISKKSKLGGR
jgi:small-conductance mechanosensitive channel